MLKRSLATVLAVLVTVSVVRADDKNAKAISEKENKAYSLVEKELSALATWCAQKNAIDEARSELDLGLALLKENKPLLDAREKLKETAKRAPKDFARDYAKKKHEAHEKCAKALADLVAFAGSKGDWDHFEERVEWIAMKAGCDEALVPKKGPPIAVWFEPYRRWLNAPDAKRLEAGGEQLDGKWLDAKEVAAANKKHSSWDDPWVISDEVHEIKTTMPLRTAKQLLVHVGAYRDMLVQYVADGWELKKPDGRLPIIVTETQKDFRERMEKDGQRKPGERMNMAAVYMHGSGALNPCYVTFEPMDESGQTTKVGIEYVTMVLQHELTHQILTEYAYSNAAHTHGEDSQYWCVEGIATFMEVWKLGRSGWKLTHPNPKNGGTKGSGNECAFAFCQENPYLPESLKGFFDLTHDHFVRADHYQIAATVSYFLLEGEGRKYRKNYLRMLQLVHENRAAKDTLRTCFPDADFDAMHKEYKQFVAGIKLDDVQTH